MTVDTLRQFLHSLSPALRGSDGGATVAGELENACRSLEPFRTFDLGAFARFLNQCADYQRTGTVASPSKFDLSGVQQTLTRIDALQDGGETHSGDGTKAELKEAQTNLMESLSILTKSVGLKGKLTVEPKWVEQQLTHKRIRAHAASLRELAAKITEPASFDQEHVRETMHRLEHDIPGAEWKLLAAEFSVPASAKGAKVLEEILFKLTGHRPIKVKATRKSTPAVVDQAKIAPFVERLQQLLNRTRSEDQFPESDVEAELTQLESLGVPELIAVATQAGIESPGKSKKAVLTRIRGKLTAGQRVLDQTAQ